MKNIRMVLAGTLVAGLSLATAGAAHAYSAGQVSSFFADGTPNAPQGCMQASGGCHGTVNGPQVPGPAAPTVTLTGPTSVAPGTGPYTYTLTVTSNDASEGHAGLNVHDTCNPAGNCGAFSNPGSGTFLKLNALPAPGTGRNEITHTGPVAMLKSTPATFTFQWSPPPGAFGSVTLIGWGNAVNATSDGVPTNPAGAGGDNANIATLVVSDASASDDTGFVPDSKGTAGCEDKLAGNLSGLAACLIKCQIKQADAELKAPGSSAEETCETTCQGKFHAAALKEVDTPVTAITTPAGKAPKVNCPVCISQNEQAALAAQVTAIVEQMNGQIYCSGITPLP